MLYRYITDGGIQSATVNLTDSHVHLVFRSSVTGRTLRAIISIEDVARHRSAMLSFGERDLESTGRVSLIDLAKKSRDYSLPIPELISSVLLDGFSFRLFVPSQELLSLRQCAAMIYVRSDANLCTNLDVTDVSGPLESKRLFNLFINPNQKDTT